MEQFDVTLWLQQNRVTRLDPAPDQSHLFGAPEKTYYARSAKGGSVLLTETQVKQFGLLGIIERSSQASLFDA